MIFFLHESSKYNLIIGLFYFTLIVGCTNQEQKISKYQAAIDKVEKFRKTDPEMKNWFKKDLENDSLPGISIEKTYEELLVGQENFETIIAVIDMSVDIHHKSLREIIWVNTDEIPDNGIDDDNNGYIDDIHGWNFIGNENFDNIKFSNYEYTRILRKYKKDFEGKSERNIAPERLKEYNLYIRALKKHKERTEYAMHERKRMESLVEKFNNAVKTISPYFSEEELDFNKMEALKNNHEGDSELQEAIDFLIDKKFTKKTIEDYRLQTYERINKMLNLDYNERVILEENAEDLSDIIYGNNCVNNNLDFFEHGTLMAGCIASTLTTELIAHKIKVMPLCISSYGDEHDKDIALAIRYAVDNGAKVINLSFGKGFSMNEKWVLEAIKHAENNNVLLVKSAGNDNLDLSQKFNYPDDALHTGEELVDNFIRVGSTSYYVNEKFRSDFSNYGKNQVDIFAPGEYIYTTTSFAKEKFRYSSGTSMSTAITSAVAGLLYSYYPNSSAKDIKNIILTAGLEYTIDVNISKKGDIFKEIVPFDKLSKSGKVINAYNAFLMAKKLHN